MKPASKCMPQYVPQKPKAWVLAVFGVLCAALVVLVVLLQPMLLLAVVGLIGLVLAYDAIFDRPKRNRHFQQLSAQRAGLSICEFARSFDANIDTWVIRAVYEQLHSALPSAHRIPIQAADYLLDTLMFDDEDVWDLAEEVAQRTGRSLEGYTHNPYYGKVTTVEHLVLFFHHQPHAIAA